jgi:cyclase
VGALQGRAEAVLAASIFHLGEFTIGQAKERLRAAGVPVRPGVGDGEQDRSESPLR